MRLNGRKVHHRAALFAFELLTSKQFHDLKIHESNLAGSLSRHMSQRYDITWSQSSGPEGRSTEPDFKVPTMNQNNNLLSFLAMVQYYSFDFLDAAWADGLEPLGRGGTAEVRELFIHQKRRYAFKRHRVLTSSIVNVSTFDQASEIAESKMRRNEKVFNEMVAEVTILGHPVIRNHQNFVRLEGVYWELDADQSDPWPVLVMEQADLGDLWSFATSEEGIATTFDDRIGICVDLAQAVYTLHENGALHPNQQLRLLLTSLRHDSRRHQAT